MKPSILSIATAVPRFHVDQETFAQTLSQALQLPIDKEKLLKKIFQNTKIKRRYSVVDDYESSCLRGSLYSDHFPDELPGSHKRNLIYKREAPVLATQSAKQALEKWGGSPKDITHVISVSCTGLMAPGIEFHLIDALGLSRDVARLAINFMGCFGAFQGLDTAGAFCEANPENRVLVVCTELCSLHMQPSGDLSKIVSNALFADGSAAVVVGAAPSGTETPLWEILRKESMAFENSSDEMTWEMGDDGCLMTLTEQVPKKVEGSVREFVLQMLKSDVSMDACEWLVHPGGKAILRAVATACGLDEKVDLQPSWDVMRDFGNMSSATFLFVLERAIGEKDFGIGIGFGPGLSLEGILLRKMYA